MSKILKAIIRHRKITVFFVMALIGAGILAYISLPKQETPEMSIPYAMVTTVYPGASQADVDTFVTKPVESVAMGIDGYQDSFSFSSNSISVVIVELRYSADRNESFSQLESRLRELQPNLPEGCQTIDLNRNITDTAGVIISLSSDEGNFTELSKQAEIITDRLSSINGFLWFETAGEKEKQVIVKTNLEKMMQMGLSLPEIATLVSSGNLDIPVGKLEEDNGLMAIDYIGTYSSVEDIKNIIVGFSPELGRLIKLSDIADIRETERLSSTRFYHNGREALLISGYFEEDINTLPLYGKINDELDSIKEVLPKGMNLSVIISQPGEIRDSLGTFSINLLVAVGLVIMVVLVGMGFRNAIVVSVSIPFSILMTFLTMYIFGIRVQQISIAAMIMSLGMLVDNSIVVSDSIQGEMDSGTNRVKSCIKGTKEVAVPVLASTLTTIAAFAPFLFLDSIAGDYIKSLPQIITIALAASYITAIIVVPVLGHILFRKRKRCKKKSRKLFFPKLLKWSMNRKAVVIVITLILLAGTVFLAIDIEKEFFPASDKDIIYIDIRNSRGDDIDGTGTIVEEITSLLDTEVEVLEYTSSVGGGLPRFNQILNVYTITPDIGQIMMRVDLNDSIHKSKGDYKDYLQQRINEKKLNARITVKQLKYAFPMDEDIRISVEGDDLVKLKEAENKVMDTLNGTDGVQNVNRGNTDYTDILEMQVNKEAAATAMTLPAEVLNQVNMAVSGREAAVLILAGKEIPVYITGDIGSTDELVRYMLKTASGNYVAAGDLLDFQEQSYLETIPRSDGNFSMLLTADYAPDVDNEEVLTEIKGALSELELEDISVIYDGESELIRENFSQVLEMGLIAIAIVFMILLIQFKTFRLPLLIFVTIPLSAIGSIAGLYILGLPISFTALLGIVSLLGIVVNNAIILIDYVLKEQAGGKGAKEACINAANRRLRPILLSTITTVIGLIPLSIGTSQLFKPMAIALMSGLLISTLLTLVVIPMAASVLLKGKNA